MTFLILSLFFQYHLLPCSHAPYALNQLLYSWASQMPSGTHNCEFQLSCIKYVNKSANEPSSNLRRVRVFNSRKGNIHTICQTRPRNFLSLKNRLYMKTNSHAKCLNVWTNKNKMLSPLHDFFLLLSQTNHNSLSLTIGFGLIPFKSLQGLPFSP